jgi:hypothetical protein
MRLREFDSDSSTHGWPGCGRGKCERCKEDPRVVAVAEGIGVSKVELACSQLLGAVMVRPINNFVKQSVRLMY